MPRFPAVLTMMLIPAVALSDPVVHHDIRLVIDARAGELQVEDSLRLPAALAGRAHITVRLNAGFPTPAVSGAALEASVPVAGGRLVAHTLRLDGSEAVRLSYSGRPLMPAATNSSEDAPAVEWFDAEGAHLGAASGWYPRVAGALMTFELSVSVPEGWRALAPGRETGASRVRKPASGQPQVSRWRAARPIEDLDVVAGPFVTHVREEPFGRSLVWLRQADEALATTYLDAVGRHLPFYARLLGAYPYPKFAVVENLRPTGWGMPSFTLLGTRVMRLPFIPHTSLPHEVLHNWWGNGVLVDLEQGNWSEGLTAYLADHLQAQHRGRGARHRRDALARFRSAGRQARAPVTFISRHDRRSQSVGYDKPLMLFHMARQVRGDEAFVTALRTLYQRGLGRRVGAREVFETLAPAGEDWFTNWWVRADAPRLQLDCCDTAGTQGGFRVSGTLRQVQAGPPYPLRVPVQVLLPGEQHAREHIVAMNAREEVFTIDSIARPRLLAIDAGFDLMRIPDLEELPPSLAEALDADDAVAVIDAGVTAEQAGAYRALAARMGARVLQTGRVPDAAGAVWRLGAGGDARWRSELERALPAGDSRVLVTREPSGRALVVVDALSPAAARALANKLSHYGRYGLLGFDSDRARNVFKGERAVSASALQVVLDPTWQGGAVPRAAEAALAPH